MIRSILFASALASASCAFGQRISGWLPDGAAANGFVQLAVSRGAKSRPVDSVAVRTDGRFAFKDRDFPRGFYHLSINDTDRVDLILDPAEDAVELLFTGTPLQRHLTVQRSDENKRLWEYKLVSKESQAIQAGAAAEKLGLQPGDTARIHALDSIAARAIALQQAYLQGIVSGYPNSYFAKMIRADRGIEAAREQNPLAVLTAFDFSDPELMRSSVYDDAVMTFLRNIRAVSEEQFVSAADSLIAYAGHDPDCRMYMIDHLIDLFATYGPELPLQHLIERYVVSPAGLSTIDPALHDKVSDLLKVAVGAEAPDVDLPGPDGPIHLRSLAAKNRYTVLFFYSSTCDHCHAEMPAVMQVYNERHAQGLDVVGIALDPDSSEFQRTIEERGLPWKCYSEFNGWGSTVAKAFRVKATPWFFVLDGTMRIVAKPVDGVALDLWLRENMR